MRAIEDYVRSVNLSSEAVQQLKDNLSQLNELKLESIRDQFDPLQQVATSAISGMQSGIEGLLNGTKSFGEAWSTFTDSIGNTLAKLAAQWLTNEFVTNILGIGKAKTPSFGGFGMESDEGFGGILGGLLGGGGGLFGSILGFADGGGIPKLDHKAYRALPVIGEALKKEGSNAVLIAATPGEYMLNIDESRAYKQMFPNGIKGFRSGGGVGSGVKNMAQNVGRGGNTNNVNISVSNVNNGSGEIDVKSLRRVVVAEITRQQEFGGVSSKVG
jgi:hypothetical protein